MSLKITPQETQVSSDAPRIRTRVPWEEVTDDMVRDRARNANFQAGDHVLVQCMNHDYTEVVAEADFVVVRRVSAMKTVDLNDRETKTFEDTEYEVRRKGQWWRVPAPAVVEPAEPPRKTRAA